MCASIVSRTVANKLSKLRKSLRTIICNFSRIVIYFCRNDMDERSLGLFLIPFQWTMYKNQFTNNYRIMNCVRLFVRKSKWIAAFGAFEFVQMKWNSCTHKKCARHARTHASHSFEWIGSMLFNRCTVHIVWSNSGLVYICIYKSNHGHGQFRTPAVTTHTLNEKTWLQTEDFILNWLKHQTNEWTAECWNT